MAEEFDADALAAMGWRQGAVLPVELAAQAREYAPDRAVPQEGDLLLVTSHDCDVVNWSLDKEPQARAAGSRLAKRRP